MNGKHAAGTVSRARPLVFLLPAALAAFSVLTSLALTEPTLPELPARLERTAAVVVSEPFALEPMEKEPPPEEPAPVISGHYEDGVYVGSAQGYGGAVTVQVTVENGNIADITILSASGETEPYITLAKTILDTVLREQTWEVDIVSGATYSSRGILGAIQNAITGETVVNEAPVRTARVIDSVSFTEPAAYRDGTYTGSAQGFGGTITVQVVIEGGVIRSATILSAPGETEPYLSSARAVIGRILSALSPNVDTVSGATYSSSGILTAVKRALAQAAADGGENQAAEDEEPDEPEPEIDPSLFPAMELNDGVYIGTGDGYGGDVIVQVTVEGGRITDVTVVSAEDETPAYWGQATGLIPSILRTQGRQVDAISGATYSSRGILEAVEDALSQAAGGTEPVEPPDEPDRPDEPEPSPPPETEALYRDGAYSATGWCEDEDGIFRYALTVTVMIEDGKLTSVEVEKGADESPEAEPEDNETYLGYALRGRTRRGVTYIGVPAQITDRQSANEIDAVSGATYSSQAIQRAVKRALEQARAEDSGDASGEPSGETSDEMESGPNETSGEPEEAEE